MARLCLDDLMRISIGDLKVRPHDYRKDVALVERPVPAAVAFELNTHSEPPFVVLSCGRTRTVVRLLPEPAPVGGLRWHFLDQSNRRALKMYWLEDVGFFSRGDLAERGIHPRVRYLSQQEPHAAVARAHDPEAEEPARAVERDRSEGAARGEAGAPAPPARGRGVSGCRWLPGSTSSRIVAGT